MKQMFWIFDFDGTISTLVPNRSEAKLDPSCKKLLTELSVLPNHYVAVLSSRVLEDILPRVPMAGIYIGSGSGIEWYLPGDGKIATNTVLGEQLELKRNELLPKIRSCFGFIPGVEIEDKKWSVAVHFRKASVESKKSIHLLMKDWAPARCLKKFHGPEVIEIELLAGIDKCYGVRRICDILHFTPGEGTLIYSGDDENDATAMQWVLNLKGIAFTVGSAALVPGARLVDSPSSLCLEIRKLARLGKLSVEAGIGS